MSYEYIEMEKLGTSPSGKTDVYGVYSVKGHDLLGTVKWFGRWRQYTFFPAEYSVFSAGCLEDVVDFLGNLKKFRGMESD